MKKLILSAVFTAITLTTFVSCSSDDGGSAPTEESNIKSQMIGEWKLTEAGGYNVNNLTLPGIKSTYIKFNSDNTFSGRGYFGTGSGTYKVLDKTIYTYIDNQPYLNYEIISIEGKTATLIMIENGTRLEIKVTKQ